MCAWVCVCKYNRHPVLDSCVSIKLVIFGIIPVLLFCFIFYLIDLCGCDCMWLWVYFTCFYVFLLDYSFYLFYFNYLSAYLALCVY